MKRQSLRTIILSTLLAVPIKASDITDWKTAAAAGLAALGGGYYYYRNREAHRKNVQDQLEKFMQSAQRASISKLPSNNVIDRERFTSGPYTIEASYDRNNKTVTLDRNDVPDNERHQVINVYTGATTYSK